LEASKNLSIREYSKTIDISTNIPTNLQPYVNYKVIFKTDEVYQNKLKWGQAFYYNFKRVGEPSLEINNLGVYSSMELPAPIIKTVDYDGNYSFIISASYQGDGILNGWIRCTSTWSVPPVDVTANFYAPPIIKIYGKIIMSIVSPR
jgi:hypothetical protein